MENISDEILLNGEYKTIKLYDTNLLVFKNGTIYKWFNKKYWKEIPNIINDNGYNRFCLSYKRYFRHRVMCFAFKNLNIGDTKRFIDHIDGDRLNNNIDNLRIVSNQENLWNQTRAKGYSWCKLHHKWHASIKVNKNINLGYFNTEQEAREAYLNAKKKYHIIEQSIEELEQEFMDAINK